MTTNTKNSNFVSLFYKISPIFFILLGIIIYSNSFSVPFHFDDILVIVENPNIKDISRLEQMWVFDPSRFLTYFSFALNYHFNTLDVFGYHLVNIILHSIVILLSYAFLRITLKKLNNLGYVDNGAIDPMSVLAVFIFASHPIQTQAVTYIAQRSTLLASLFYLTALLCYILYRDSNRFNFYFLAFLSTFLGLFTKPIIVSLPAAIFLYEICFYNDLKRSKTLALIMPFLGLVSIVPFLLMQYKFDSMDAANLLAITRETASLTRWEYLLTQFNVIITYMRLILLPIKQSLDYMFPVTKSFFEFPTWISFGIIVSIIFFAIKLFKTQRLISFGIFWIVVTLSLESSIFPIADVINEHRLYLPMVGISLLMAYYLIKLFRNGKIAGIAACILVLAYSVMTYQRNSIWANRIGFLEDVAQKANDKTRVHNNLAIAYMESGDYIAAEREYKKAIAMDPKYASGYSNLANVYFELGRYDEAEELLLKAIKLKPKFAGAYYNLGNLYYTQNKSDLAMRNYLKAVKISPNFALAFVSLGKLYAKHRDWPRGMFALKHAIYLNPGHYSGYLALADLYLNRGLYDEAIEQYQESLKRKPDQMIIHNNMGNIYDILGDYTKAEKAYRRALHLDPEYAHAYFNLAHTLKKQGKGNEVAQFLSLAIKFYKQNGDEGMARKAQMRLDELK